MVYHFTEDDIPGAEALTEVITKLIRDGYSFEEIEKHVLRRITGDCGNSEEIDNEEE